MKAHKFEIILGRIFLVLLSLSLAFFAVELFSRSFLSNVSNYEKIFPKEVTRSPYPYIMFKGDPNYEKHNSLGYPGQLPQEPKPAGEFRIIVLGGSTIYAGDPPIPVLLEENFKKNNFPNVKVYNFGVSSAVSGQDLARLVFEVPPYEPDLIIFYNGGNDITQPLTCDPRPGYPLDFMVHENNPLYRSDIHTYPTLWMTAYGSQTLRYLFPKHFLKKFITLPELREGAGFLSDQWREKIASSYIDNMVTASKVAKGMEIPAVVIFQPVIHFKNKELLTKDEKIHYPSEEDVALVFDLRARILRMAEGSAKTFPDFHFYDESLFYSDNPKYIYRDIIHTTPQAMGMMADEIFAKVVDLVKRE